MINPILLVGGIWKKNSKGVFKVLIGIFHFPFYIWPHDTVYNKYLVVEKLTSNVVREAPFSTVVQKGLSDTASLFGLIIGNSLPNWG